MNLKTLQIYRITYQLPDEEETRSRNVYAFSEKEAIDVFKKAFNKNFPLFDINFDDLIVELM